MKNILNEKTKGARLYAVDMLPMGEHEIKTVYVYARNRLDASNWLILNRYYGEQFEIRYCSANLLK